MWKRTFVIKIVCFTECLNWQMAKHKISESLEPCMRPLLIMSQTLDKGEVAGSDKRTSLQCCNIDYSHKKFFSEGFVHGTHKISWASFTCPTSEADFSLS